MGMLENYLLRGYEKIIVPEDVEKRNNLIREYDGRRVGVLDENCSGALWGRLEALEKDGEYVIQPRFGRGKILFSTYLLDLIVKSESRK